MSHVFPEASSFHILICFCIRVSVSHLVGLVDVVAVQGAEQVLQPGDVVVINGVDDGLHHKGVLLILDGWERQLPLHCSQT